MLARIRKRSGFAMPMTILVLFVLAVGITGTFSFVTSERRVIDNITLQQNAFLTAQSGLDEYLSNRSGLGFIGMPGARETVTLDIRDGTAEIVLERIRPAIGGNPPLYVVRSTGVIPGPRPQDPDARRTVAQLAQWQAGTMVPNAAWVSLSGFHKNGSAGTISGQDQCGANPAVPGVAVPQEPGYSVNGDFDPEGDPSVEEWASIVELIEEVGVNWEGIVDQSAITPDIVMPGDSWPSFDDPSYWPIIHVTGDLRLPSTGRGILIVTGGSLTVSGSRSWSGLVLVGEHLISNGNNQVSGATLTGLDAMLQDDPQEWIEDLGKNSVGNGNKSFVYNSCTLEQALESFGGFAVIENAWMDNWPEY